MTSPGVNLTEFFSDNATITVSTTNLTDLMATSENATYTQEHTTPWTTVTTITQEVMENLNDTSTTANQTFVYNHTLSPFVPDGQDFFHHLSGKDETLFLTLVLMAVLIPILFIAIFAVVCVRKRREKKARRAERLLRNAQDLAMDDYPPAMYRIQALRA
ncbi:uncharacterized protein LOC135462688 [Liolophura sinensis]|uniref:uncharacterized protein LOC135462688 n=1 Tax=Liolophura sinensis TaxID=3198878 RepID=UPI00315817A5